MMTKVVELLLGQEVMDLDTDIPETDEAKLKFYLHCVSQLFDIDDDRLCNNVGGFGAANKRKFKSDFTATTSAGSGGQCNGIIRKFTDYKSEIALTRNGDMEDLLMGCTKYCPYVLKGKVMFNDVDLCGDSPVKIFEINTVNHGYTVSGNIFIDGKMMKINRILVFKKYWIKNYWRQPMRRLIHVLSEKD